MSKDLITACLALILCLAIATAPALSFDKPPAPPGQSGDSPGNSGNAPGKNKDKDKDKDKDKGEGEDDGESEGDEDSGDAEDSEDDDGTPAKQKAKITWELSKAEVGDGLVNDGSVVVPFHTSGLLENVECWLTPSLDPYLEVLTGPFALLEPGVTYEVEIGLKGEQPTKTIGGTLHLVPIQEGEDGLRRTYPKPLPINAKFRGDGEGEDGDDGDDGEEPPDEDPVVGVVSSASYDGDGIVPLQIVSIFGFGIGPDDFQPAIIEDGKITDYLADVQVFFDGTAAPILFVSNGQVNVIVPSDVAGKSEVTVTITYQGNTWEVEGVPVLEAAPEIFSMTGLGHGLAAAIDANGEIVNEENPVAPGEVVTFFGTGVGLWKDGFIDGTIVDPASLPEPMKPVEITIGGVVAEVLYIGGAPGMANGVVQFNVTIPTDMIDVDDSVDPPRAPIELTSGGHSSKAEIYIYIEAPA